VYCAVTVISLRMFVKPRSQPVNVKSPRMGLSGAVALPPH
jgi:hypothetical protein